MGSELVNIQGGALSKLPDFLKDVQGHDGAENISKKDLILPRLAVCQGGNPQRKRANPLYIEGLEEGQFFNNVTNEIYGSKIQFIPLVKTGSRIFFRDLKEGGGIICRSFNGIDGGTIAPTCDACHNSKWGTKGETPQCTEFMNYPAIVIGEYPHLAVSSWKSTSLKPARVWLTRIDMLVEKWNKPLFSWVSEVQLNPDKNEFGEFYVPTFTVKRWATDKEFAYAQSLYNELKGKTIVVDDEHEESTENIPF